MSTSIPIDNLPGLREFAVEAFGFDPWSLTQGHWGASSGDDLVLPVHLKMGFTLGTMFLAKRHGCSDDILAEGAIWSRMTRGNTVETVGWCLWVGIGYRPSLMMPQAPSYGWVRTFGRKGYTRIITDVHEDPAVALCTCLLMEVA